jgi:hypothetical protein
VAPTEHVANVQGSKGVVSKAKFKLKPLTKIGQQKGAKVTSTQRTMTINPLSKDENDPY